MTGLIDRRHKRAAVGAVLDRRDGSVVDAKAAPLRHRDVEMAAEDCVEGEAVSYNGNPVVLFILRPNLLDGAPRPFLDLVEVLASLTEPEPALVAFYPRLGFTRPPRRG